MLLTRLAIASLVFAGCSLGGSGCGDGSQRRAEPQPSGPAGAGRGGAGSAAGGAPGAGAAGTMAGAGGNVGGGGADVAGAAGAAGNAGDAGNGGATGKAGAPGGASGSGGGGGADGPVPPFPQGWSKWTGWTPDCPIYYPAPGGYVEPPIEWEACGPGAPKGVACERMTTPWWDSKSGTLAVGAASAKWVNGKLRFWMLRHKGEPVNSTSVIADDGGEVLSAWHTEGGGWCHWLAVDPQASHMAVGISQNHAQKSDSTGFLASLPGLGPPTLQGKWPVSTGQSHVDTARDGVLRFAAGTLTLQKWTETTTTKLLDVSQTGMGIVGQNAFDDWVVIRTGSSVNTSFGGWLWSEKTGALPIHHYPNDASKGADYFNTDGVDMVWTWREGGTPGTGYYPMNDVYTAKFSTSAAEVEKTKRRLRSEPPGPSYFGYWHLGCGYAVDGRDGLAIVRLADGAMWKIASTTEFFPGIVAAVTCDHVFFQGFDYVEKKGSVYRIRLDSLGAPMLPD